MINYFFKVDASFIYTGFDTTTIVGNVRVKQNLYLVFFLRIFHFRRWIFSIYRKYSAFSFLSLIYSNVSNAKILAPNYRSVLITEKPNKSNKIFFSYFSKLIFMKSKYFLLKNCRNDSLTIQNARDAIKQSRICRLTFRLFEKLIFV